MFILYKASNDIDRATQAQKMKSEMVAEDMDVISGITKKYVSVSENAAS